MSVQKTILLTFDVEDWFQVENLRSYISFSSWNHIELRVEQNTQHILDLLDGCNFKNTENATPKATFFLLGWIAERLPNLVREISNRGHEVASHGFDHKLCTSQSESELKNDLIESKKLLEDIVGKAVTGYRAPSFSISDPILKTLRSCGYRYDSSFNNFDKHGRYGRIDLNSSTHRGAVYRIEDDFYEIPLSNLSLFNTIVPWAGGGYFRLFPFNIFKLGIKHILARKNTYVFYAHPWEFDPGQPIIREASRINRLKHYTNLAKTSQRLADLIARFSYCRFLACQNYIDEIWGKNEQKS